MIYTIKHEWMFRNTWSTQASFPPETEKWAIEDH